MYKICLKFSSYMYNNFQIWKLFFYNALYRLSYFNFLCSYNSVIIGFLWIFSLKCTAVNFYVQCWCSEFQIVFYQQKFLKILNIWMNGMMDGYMSECDHKNNYLIVNKKIFICLHVIKLRNDKY